MFFENCPVDIPLWIIDDYHNIYLATMRANPRMPDGRERGEVIKGDADTFYRNALITWAYIK